MQCNVRLRCRIHNIYVQSCQVALHLGRSARLHSLDCEIQLWTHFCSKTMIFPISVLFSQSIQFPICGSTRRCPIMTVIYHALFHQSEILHNPTEFNTSLHTKSCLVMVQSQLTKAVLFLYIGQLLVHNNGDMSMPGIVCLQSADPCKSMPGSVCQQSADRCKSVPSSVCLQSGDMCKSFVSVIHIIQYNIQHNHGIWLEGSDIFQYAK